MGPKLPLELDPELIDLLLRSASEVASQDSLLGCLIPKWKAYKALNKRQPLDFLDWLRSFQDTPYQLLPQMDKDTIDSDWREITEFIKGYSIEARKDAYIGGVPLLSRYWKGFKRYRNPNFVVTPLRDVLAYNSKCKPDSFVSFLCENEKQSDGVRFGRVVYFFRLCLTSGLQHHPFAFIDHIKVDKVYTALSTPQCTVVDINKNSWLRDKFDYSDRGKMNLFLSCYSLRFTNIAVAAYPYSVGDNRMKKVSFCCVNLGRVWPGCSDASLLDTLDFDIDPPASRDEDAVNIEDADDAIILLEENEAEHQFPRLCKSGIPKMVIDFILANRNKD